MDPVLDAREQQLVGTARDFARERVTPHAAAWERERSVPRDTLRAAAEAGLAGLLVPKHHGGQGVSYTAMARIMEELSRGCMAFAFSLVVHNNLAGSIARNGSPALIEHTIPSLVAGERIGAFCLTESGVGSDAAAITTTAREEDDCWVLDGEKAWVTNGTVADLLSIYVQTDAQQGWRGIACLLVDGDAPGLHREEAYALMGGHAMGTAGLTLKNCRVPAERMLIPPGEAFKAAMTGINIARANVGAMCCGILSAGLERALDYTAQRQIFGRPVAGFQGVQWQLADVATELEAARLLTYQATSAIDRGEDGVVEAAHAKKYASRVALTGLSACMQVMGANGFRAEEPLGRHMASAKMAQYLDGATEIQNVVISRALLRSRGVDTA